MFLVDDHLHKDLSPQHKSTMAVEESFPFFSLLQNGFVFVCVWTKEGLGCCRLVDNKSLSFSALTVVDGSVMVDQG